MSGRLPADHIFNFNNGSSCSGILTNVGSRLFFQTENVMIGFTTRTQITFNERVIHSNWSAMNRGPMAKAGNTVRKIARRSIRRQADPTKHAPPGSPPFAHDTLYSTPRFKMIFSVPDRAGTRAVVGMEGLYGAASPAPHLQEYGGTAYRSFSRFVDIRRKSGKLGRTRKVYRGIVNIPPRPFMRPALKTAVDRGYLPAFWANSLDRAYVRAA